MKLSDITEKQARHICKLLGEPFVRMMVNNDGKWDDLGLAISITTTTTLNGDYNDSSINIFKDGVVTLSRNNGNWNGMRDEKINAMLVTDYLKFRGYEFETGVYIAEEFDDCDENDGKVCI